MSGIFILCTGPSFDEFDLSLIPKDRAIGCNWAQQRFPAKYHAFVDPRHLDQCFNRCGGYKEVFDGSTMETDLNNGFVRNLGSGLKG